MQNRIFLPLLLGLFLLPGLCRSQAQPLSTSRMFLFQSGLALTLKEGNLKFDNGRVLIEDIPEALYDCFWLNPAGDYNILKTVYGADTVLQDAEARNFFDILKANVGSEARVTYKVGTEVEDVEGLILPFGIKSDLARIQRVTGGTVFIQRDQVLMVSVNNAGARTQYQEMVIGNSTAVEIDKNTAFAQLQALFLQRGFAWEPSYNLQVNNERHARLAMKAIIHNRGNDIAHANIKLVIGSPSFRTAKDMDGSLRQLINTLPPYSFAKAINTNSMVQVITGEDTHTDSSTQHGHLTTEMLGYDNRTQLDEMYVLDAGSMSLKRNSKAYLPVFDKEMGIQQNVVCHIPNFIANPQGPAEKTPAQPVNVFLALQIKNTSGFPLLPGTVFVTDEKGASLGQNELVYTPADSTLNLHLQRANHLKVTVQEDVYSEELRVRLEDKTIVDRITIRGVITLSNTDKKPAIIQVSKELAGIVTKRSGATMATQAGKRGLNNLQRLEWSIPVPGNVEQRLAYEFIYYRQP